MSDDVLIRIEKILDTIFTNYQDHVVVWVFSKQALGLMEELRKQVQHQRILNASYTEIGFDVARDMAVQIVGDLSNTARKTIDLLQDARGQLTEAEIDGVLVPLMRRIASIPREIKAKLGEDTENTISRAVVAIETTRTVTTKALPPPQPSAEQAQAPSPEKPRFPPPPVLPPPSQGQAQAPLPPPPPPQEQAQAPLPPPPPPQGQAQAPSLYPDFGPEMDKLIDQAKPAIATTLLDQIKQGTKLRAVSKEAPKEESAKEPEGEAGVIFGALASALEKRRLLTGGNDEAADDDDGNDDDDDWSYEGARITIASHLLSKIGSCAQCHMPAPFLCGACQTTRFCSPECADRTDCCSQ